MGGTPLQRKIAQLPKERRARIDARAEDLIAEELSLRDLRKAMNRTQFQMAKTLNVGQDTVSRYERRTDMLLSTLQEYVACNGRRTGPGRPASPTCSRCGSRLCGI